MKRIYDFCHSLLLLRLNNNLLVYFLQTDINKQSSAIEEWKEAEREMKRLLNKGAEFCYLEGLIDADTKHKYTMSGTLSTLVKYTNT